MQCPRCKFDNPGSALYCSQCGACLLRQGTSTWQEDDAYAESQLEIAREAVYRLSRYIPPAIAEGILRDHRRLQGERREVTILFADAAGFTHLSESLDAESIFDLINDLLGRLVECIHRYDGMVDKFTGDGLMAVFGAPIAHENDPELAIHAALDMQKAAAEFEPIARAQLGAQLQIRIGIHCGPAVAGPIGNYEQMAYTVIGETVNLASRIESLARPGHVLVSGRVYDQAHALFHFQAMGTAQVKGISQPIAIYEAVGDRSEPLPTRGVAGVTSFFLGRDAELQQLKALSAGFLADGRGRWVVIQGEAGLGKSRLMAEGFSGLVSSQVQMWQGRGLPYAQGVGYGVFRSLMQNAVSTLAPVEPWDAHISASLRPFLARLLGLTPSPEEQSALRFLEPERVKQLTILALREWVLNNAANHPVVLILDDFHWADDLSHDMLRSLIELVCESPVLVCVAARPQTSFAIDFEAEFRDRGLSSLYAALDLKPLSPEYSRMVLSHLVDLGGLPESLVASIMTRAEGNPFYIEEFVRMLIEKEVLTLEAGQWRVVSAVALQSAEIPTTLRGLMMARVDRLPEDLQDVLRSAAVIGLQFSTSLLDEVEKRIHGPESVIPSLDRLKDLGLLVERPEAGPQVYAFRHILTQETVYRSLLRSQRPAFHLTVAECTESLYADDLGEYVEVLALHYDLARVRDKAMQYALLAGERARERFANREAIEYYSRALQFSQHLAGCEEARWKAAVGLGEVEQLIGEYEEAIACYRAALDEWGEATRRDRTYVMFRLAQVWEKRGDHQESEGWLHQGLAQLGDADGDCADLRAQIYSELGWLYLRQGDLNAAQSRLEQGLALIEGLEDYGVLSSILNRLAAVYYHRGEWDRAAEYVQSALEIREQLGDIVGVARSSNNLGILKKSNGDWDGALIEYERAVELHQRIGEVEGLALALTNLGVLYTDRGEWSKAEENLQRSFAIAQRIAHPYELAQAHLNLGRLYLLEERWAECTRHLNAAIPLYDEAGARAHLNLSDAYWVKGVLCIEQGQVEEAVQWAEQSRHLLREVAAVGEGESVEWGRYEQLMGRIARAQSDAQTALSHWEKGIAIFFKSNSQIEAGRTAYLKGLLLLEQDQPGDARNELDTARTIFVRVGAMADLKRVQEKLSALSPG